MAERKIMLDREDEQRLLLAAVAVKDALRTLRGIDARRYGGPKKKETKIAIYDEIAELRKQEKRLNGLVADSRALREEMF